MVVFSQNLIQVLTASSQATDSVAVLKCSASLAAMGKEADF